MSVYNTSFYRGQQEDSKKSAEEVVPIILALIHPKSVIDIGCGVGTWLSVFERSGVYDISGIDGDWVNKEMLQISENNFEEHDLREPLTKARKYDLVVSLEVAEHLSAEYAETFVNSLTNLGSIIMFSAAIPYQGGHHHVNEQWPEYWIELFLKHGFVPVDAIRGKIWNNEKVNPWYAQNILIFVKKTVLVNYPLLLKEYDITKFGQISIVHPKTYLSLTKASGLSNVSIKQLLIALPMAVKVSIRKNFGKK